MLIDLKLVDAIREHWGWTGVDPVRVRELNPWGNIIVEDTSRRYWRVSPELLYCKVVGGGNYHSYDMYKDRTEEVGKWFLWHQDELYRVFKAEIENMEEGYTLHLRVPFNLGGKYEPNNVEKSRIIDVIAKYGDIAKENRHRFQDANYQ